MAERATAAAIGEARIPRAADVGGGRGEWARTLSERSDFVLLVDYAPPDPATLPSNVATVQGDLNDPWPIPDASIDFAFALEVIEHVENPRHFFREIARILAPDGFAFLSTPNNHSAASKLTFLLRGQHRLFQEPSYPAHITPLLICDVKRIAAESQLDVVSLFWSNQDTIPRLHWRLPLGGKWFSDAVGVLCRKPATESIHRDLR